MHYYGKVITNEEFKRKDFFLYFRFLHFLQNENALKAASFSILSFCNFICVKFGLSSLYIALLAIGRYSNFWGGMTESYYYERTQDYR